MEEIKQRLEHREKELQKLEKKSNAVADEVFAGFCANIGIRNIREYEDRELRSSLISYSNKAIIIRYIN